MPEAEKITPEQATEARDLLIKYLKQRIGWIESVDLRKHDREAMLYLTLIEPNWRCFTHDYVPDE